jgi:hypothetical protein
MEGHDVTVRNADRDVTVRNADRDVTVRKAAWDAVDGLARRPSTSIPRTGGRLSETVGIMREVWRATTKSEGRPSNMKREPRKK